jgi:hypothetical protein
VDFQQLAQSLEPFMNAAGDTYIRITVDGCDNPQEIPIESPVAENLVRAMLCPLIKRGFPTDHESRVALKVIVGYAFKRPRREAQFSAIS